MKKNGFTLIEIIGAIVILGIIAIIAFATYTSSLKGFRENYYTSERKTLEKSAQEFFDDNRSYRPTKILNAQDVSIETLATKQYMNLLTDYNGEACDSSSYALIVNEGEGNFSYHACLICDKDGYDNTTEDVYCDKSWLDPTKVEYGIGTVNKIYVYKGTTREKLKEQLELPISYMRKNNNGKVIAERRGTREGSEILSPVDIDAVDTNTIGNYKVTYKYGLEEKTREVRVYEHKAPNIVYEKENIVAKNLSGETKKEKKTYTPGEWAQSVIVTLSSKAFEDTNITGKGYQWNVDGRWQDFCNSDPCTKTVTREMNQSVEFRLVDINDNVSMTTSSVIFKIDRTSPICSLKVPTTKGDNDWYKTNVDIQFNEKTDPKVGNDSTIVSGIKQYNIQASTENLTRVATTVSKTHTQDTGGIKYIGYVEDEAENFSTCEVTIKKDSTKPSCNYSGQSSSWTKNDRTITYGCDDSLSGCATGFSGGTKPFDSTTRTAIIPSYIIKDNAGNTKVCDDKSVNVFVDKTEPTCNYSGESTKWSNANRVITYGCEDSDSGCAEGTGGGTKTFDKTATTGKIESYIIKDKAGNQKTCEEKEVNVFVDKTDPVCKYDGESTTWTKNDRTITYGCIDSNSGCAEGTGGGTKTFDKTTITGKIGSYTIKDKAGNQKTCGEKEVDVYVDKTPPLCKYDGESTNWSNQNKTIKSSCTDEHSKCVKDVIASITVSETKKTVDVAKYTIQDKAGNTTVCETKEVNVYVDKKKPDCVLSGDSTTWTTNDRTIKYLCDDSHSGCASGFTGGTVTFNTTTIIGKIGPYDIKDNAGNKNKCEQIDVNVYVGKPLKCSAGNYLNKTKCETCLAGKYCPGGTYNVNNTVQGINDCPSGYTNGGTGKSAISQCIKSVPCGKYVEVAKGAEKNCDPGYYKGAHDVSYGSISACSAASVGYYVPNAGACSQTACDTGYTSDGGSSSCYAACQQTPKEAICGGYCTDSEITYYDSSTHTVTEASPWAYYDDSFAATGPQPIPEGKCIIKTLPTGVQACYVFQFFHSCSTYPSSGIVGSIWYSQWENAYGVSNGNNRIQVNAHFYRNGNPHCADYYEKPAKPKC